MKRRRLGKTGLVVSEICLGTMTFGNMSTEKESLEVLDKAFDMGVDFLDVAELYPVPPNPEHAGRSEQIVGKWLKGRSRDAVIVATKVAGPGGGWFVPPARGGRTSLDRHHIERAVDASLQRLGTDYIDLYQTHWPDPDLPIEDTLEALARVIEAGKVRYVGCSNETAYGLTRALSVAKYERLPRYETIQNNFSLLNRRFEDELSTVCKREQVSCLPYSPIAGGMLSGKYQDNQWPERSRFTSYKQGGARTETMTKRFVNDKTRESTARLMGIASEHGIAPVTFAVAWTLSRDFVGSTIIGARTPDQLDDSLKAADVKLPKQALDAVDQLTREVMYPMG
jgi:aryl-alcohol dehydrogenase-like predicted oxidoreductase